MSKDPAKPRVRIVRPRIPKFCICPFCKTKQRFKKVKEHWKTVKEIDKLNEQLVEIYEKLLDGQLPRDFSN